MVKSSREGYKGVNKRPHGTTVIAVRTKDKIVLGADSLTSAGNYPFNRRSVKIHKLAPNIYMGIAGYCAVEPTFLKIVRSLIKGEQSGGTRGWRARLHEWWETLRLLDTTGGGEEGLAKALIGGEEFAVGVIISPEGVYELWSEGGFFKVGGVVYGIGTGGEFAEGAARALLKAGWKDGKKIVREAIKIAAKCCLTANARPKIVEVKRK